LQYPLEDHLQYKDAGEDSIGDRDGGVPPAGRQWIANMTAAVNGLEGERHMPQHTTCIPSSKCKERADVCETYTLGG
jgi:hypothetical protein